jgi:hypothetical protein
MLLLPSIIFSGLLSKTTLKARHQVALAITPSEFENFLPKSISMHEALLLYNAFKDKELEKEILNKDHEKEILNKDHEKEILNKDHEKEILNKVKDHEKEIEILNKVKDHEKEIEILNKVKDHEKEIEILNKDNLINNLSRELLESKSSCTSRGILEYYLKAAFSELGLKGTYNSRTVCDSLISHRLTESSTRTYPKSEVILLALKKCNVEVSKLYGIYGKLSEDIHGKPWSGPSVKIISNLLKEEEVCLIKSLSSDLGFIVEEE